MLVTIVSVELALPSKSLRSSDRLYSGNMSGPGAAARFASLSLAVLIGISFGALIRRDASPDDLEDFAPYQGKRFSTFDWNLLQTMAKNSKSEGGNLLISPISLKLALVLLFEGSKDDTARELANAMQLPVGLAATRDKFTSILDSLQIKKEEFSLKMGTRIFLDNSVLPRQLFTSVAKMFYKTELQNVNFKETHPTCDLINNFVRNITDSHIDKVITDADSLKDNIMMIVSTMFFHGTWYRHPFLKNQTKIDRFSIDEKSSVQVPFMRASSKFYYVYAEELQAKILRLPYSGHKFAMYIVLPQAPGNLESVMRKISPYNVNRYVWFMQELFVDVEIPKFKFDITNHFEKHLRQLGIREIFDDTATLTGILRSKSTSKRLVVSDILQKAAIQVDEDGTLASTATTIEIGNKINDETFHAKQPFLFFIEDESSGTNLYMGIVNNPREETGMEAAQPQIPLGTGTQPLVLTQGEVATSGIGTGASDRQNFFNIQLLQELNALNPGNVIVGTSSVKTALMLLAEASAGRTRNEISSALRLPSESSSIRENAAGIVTSFKDPRSKTELQSVTKLWLAENSKIRKNFSDTVEATYGGELERLNLENTSGAVKTINDWVKKYTRGRIDSIVDSSSLTVDTKLLLTTAVYFSGTWLNAFDKSVTRSKCFDVPEVGCQQMPLMETIGNFKYALVPALDAEVIQIPYTSARISMLVFLPKRHGKEALQELSRDLSFAQMSVILASLQESEILLQLPRFSISGKTNLRAALEKLGVRDLFTSKANLTAAFPQGAQVGAVLHNAMIEVNEEGTIAAAATGASVIPLMGQTRTVFLANRPFLFLLLDSYSNSILFAGRFMQPDA